MDSLYQPPASQQIYKSSPSPQYCGLPIEEYFATRFSYQSLQEWIAQIQNGNISVNGVKAQTGYILQEGDCIITHAGVRQEPPANRQLKVVYQDTHIRVFNKPAPIPVHPSGRYFQNSMTEVLKKSYPEEVPRPVQRLDATTTGVIVFAKTRQAAGILMEEFKSHRIKKEYLALVEGEPKEENFCIDAPIGVLNGSHRGVGDQIKNAKSAKTNVQWLASKNGYSLLKVVPLSGRTNQIRVHLSSYGLPIYNDQVYGQGSKDNYQYGLHAWGLEFQLLDRTMEFRVEPPSHFEPLLKAAKNK
ncbi:MAG: RluA family pseudouridine synthase [Nitrospina sp.]|nr:RluA family pseudouridine synthase [Nitrospina sp.]MBT6717796.1 RluA family pseudouridine synthase [Nitrospina sp.]